MAKILVIEDDPVIRENIHEMLEFEDFEVNSASNGFEGLQQARIWLPDLIVCDVMMPEMDGFMVLEELRRDSLTATVPFVFLTAKASRMDMRTGMSLGADDYLTKPFTNQELLHAVRTRLERHAAIETQRLRTLSQKLLIMQESERLQVARDLHNEANQILAGLKLVLETSHRLPQDANRARLKDALDLVSSLAGTLSDLSFDLRPLVLDDLGLLPALSQYFDQFTRRTTIEVAFRHAGLQHRFDADAEITVFRIVQEALNNVAQHTALRDVRVQIWADGDRLQVRIEDHGPGFDLESTLRRSEAGGLMRMHGRAVLLGGHLRIESVPGMGTTVQAIFPVKPATDATASSTVTSVSPAEAPRIPAAAPVGPASEQVTIMLADSHDLTRQGMRSLLETEPAFTIVGEATQGRSVLDLIDRVYPAVLIVDFTLPGLNGIDITRYVSKHNPDTRVLIISLHEGEAYVLEALKSGATGYALKQSAASDLIQAVYEVAAGRRYLSPTLSERAIEAYLNLQHNQDDSLDVYGQLTRREHEVLQLVVDGLTSAEIGDRLGISPRTVEKHRANMMQKLGLRNQADLVRYALEHGFAGPG